MTKTSGSKVSSVNREKWLKQLLYLFMMGNVIGIFDNLSSINNHSLPIYMPVNLIIFRIINAFLSLIAMFAILKWKKWGVYLQGIVFMAGTIITIVVNRHFNLSGFILSFSINFLIYWYLIKPLWKKFQ